MQTEIGHSTRNRDPIVMLRGGASAALVAFGAVMLAPRDARACGACYASSSESTVVNDHKMALAISKQRTVLWDQISYSGSPTEFAYVVPARPGTRVEPSADAWFAALDASTRPILMAPQSLRRPGGPAYGGSEGDWGHAAHDHAGCGCSGESSEASFESAGAASDAGRASTADAGAGAAEREPVDVVEQKVVGPYETVTLRSTEPRALETWLRDHGFAIPAASGPIIDEYVKNGFDFIALRLRPESGVRAIEPVRIVAPGPDPTLPLRMMQIGAGASLGITLWVVGEGRWHTANFPDGAIDFDQLIWDYAQSRSNYQELAKKAMAANGGRSFLTEYADAPDLDPMSPPPGPTMASNIGLASAYRSACPAVYVPKDAGADARVDAGDPADAEAADAGDEAGVDDAGKPPVVENSTCDDLDVALDGLAPADVRITRLRANLPYSALADTLRLEPAPSQARFENVHYAKTTGTIQARIARPAPSGRHGTYALVAATAFLVSRILRRRRRG
jgi:hypothetical protein